MNSSKAHDKSQENIGKSPYLVTIYHMVLILIALIVPLLFLYADIRECEHLRLFLYSGCFGVLGGAVNASRYVVLAVRYGNYDDRRLLWQLTTPIHSGVLAWIAIIAVKGGLLTLGTDSPDQERYLYFVMAMSFFVGLISEAFLKRLITAAEALIGEKHGMEEVEKKKEDRASNE